MYQNGIDFQVGDQVIHKEFSIRLFMLDSPARADICKIMSHGSYQGCPFCKFTNKVGGQKKRRMTHRMSGEAKLFIQIVLVLVYEPTKRSEIVCTQSITNRSTDRNARF